MAEMRDNKLERDVRTALDHDAGDEAILDIIRAYKSNGGDQRIAYDSLEAIRCEMEEDSPERERVEAVMDIVWGFCPRDKQIWSTNLSDD